MIKMKNDHLSRAPGFSLPMKTVPSVFLASLFLMFLAFPAYAQGTDAGIDWFQMAIQLFGGLAIFLFGMDMMANALKRVAGEKMKEILSRLTSNRFAGLFTGAFVTAVIQSSSVTTVILVGFVTTGLMSLAQAVGVILGANIGTTITAQIVAFKVTKYALFLVAGGFATMFAAKKDKIKQYGLLVMGLGLIFFGMGIMSAGMKPLRTYEPFIDLMGTVSNPLIGIAVAALFTGLVQSSSATMGVVIALALQGLITLEAGIAMALGANVGTCVTAGLAAIGKPREAVRVAFAHVAFNVIGVLIIVWFIGPLADLVRAISPVDGQLEGAERLAAETPRQIANAHSIFNIAVAVLFLPFLAPFARLCEWVVKDKPLEEELIIKPKYLEKNLLSTPTFALEGARFEIIRLGKRVSKMLKKILPAALSGTADELEEIANMDDKVDALFAHIINYLGQISVRKLSESENKTLMRLFDIVQQLEEIGDIIESRMVMLGLRRIEDNIKVSDATLKKINSYHERVVEALDLMLLALKEQDPAHVKKIRSMKQDLARLAEESARHEVGRLTADAPNRLNTYSREIETLDQLSAIFRRCRRISKIAIFQK